MDQGSARARLGVPQRVLPPMDTVARLDGLTAMRAHARLLGTQPRLAVLEAAGREAIGTTLTLHTDRWAKHHPTTPTD